MVTGFVLIIICNICIHCNRYIFIL